jgi:hypothetical protein
VVTFRGLILVVNSSSLQHNHFVKQSNDAQVPCSAFWLRTAAVASASILLLQLLRWPLTAVLTVFLEPFLEIAVGLTFLGCTIACLVHAIRSRSKGMWQAGGPLAICLLTIVALFSVPFNALYFNANFALFRARRMEVAREIVEHRYGQVERNFPTEEMLALDAKDHLLSDDGEVMVDTRPGKPFIIFFIFRGILERFSGYIYSPNDQPPEKDEFGGDGREIERVAPNWFWYAS